MVYFDTLHYAKALKEVGFSEEQAETLATKTNLLAVENRLKAEIQKVKNEIHDIKSETRLLRWMITIGATFAGVGTILIKLFF